MKQHVHLLLLLLAASPMLAQTSTVRLRIATYHLSGYDSSASTARAGHINTVVRHIHPDILVVQGIEGGAGTFERLYHDGFRTAVADPQRAPFSEGDARITSDNGMFFDGARVELIRHATVATPTRNIDEYVVAPRGTSDTIHILTCHLTGSDDAGARETRRSEAAIIRARTAAIPPTHHYMVAGNLNLYGAEEDGYAMLTGSPSLNGDLHDPINAAGPWHASEQYAAIHTQSTRLRTFDGGSGGGMDDRFDLILISPSLLGHYQALSYTTVGNDGRHLNDSITAGVNASVPADVLTALYNASDHLPVYADFTFDAASSGVRPASPAPVRMNLSLYRMQHPFAQPQPRPTDFAGTVLMKSLEEPAIDIFGATFKLPAFATRSALELTDSKWWGPPPSAPSVPAGRSSEP